MDVMNVKELAKYLKCSESAIRNLVRDNAIPHFRIGAKINFNKEAINNWIENQEKRSTLKVVSQNEIRSIRNIM